MANFVVVVDSDQNRKQQFLAEVECRIAPVDGLISDRCCAADFCAIWAVDSSAPLSCNVDAVGQPGDVARCEFQADALPDCAAAAQQAALVWGEAFLGNGRRVDAESLPALWPADSQPGLQQNVGQPFDGYYAALVYRRRHGLMFGADLLGTFPVYYYATNDFLLIASSPELFRYHAGFKEIFNPAGLVGMLLVMHIFDGQTLLKGVKRLAAGHVLCWQHGGVAQERQQYRLPVSNNYFSLPFSAHVELLDQALAASIQRQSAGQSGADQSGGGQSVGLLLSGGLDSRMLAGYLNEQGTECAALTLGAGDDQEMRCARRVARTLGLSHYQEPIRFERYPFYARQQARWEHVANGFNTIMHWGIYSRLRTLAPRIVLGHMLDGAIGTNTISWAYSAATRSMSFDHFFEKINAWGIQPPVLKQLLLGDVFGELVDETLEKIKATYERYSDLESQRAWCFNLQHRQRFHVGSAAWPLSFGAWPMLPVLDREVLACAAAMPAATIAERRGQIALLCQRFPALAALPLDRNTGNTTPLQPRLRYLLYRYTLGKLRDRLGKRAAQQRYYVRIYDLNGAGWSAVRRSAQPCRQHSIAYFNQPVLDHILPAVPRRFDFNNEIIDASGPKSLLGFLLWLDNRH